MAYLYNRILNSNENEHITAKHNLDEFQNVMLSKRNPKQKNTYYIISFT